MPTITLSEGALAELRAALAAPATTPVPPPTPDMGGAWPRLITVDGVQLMAEAPINPAWKVSQWTHIFAAPPNHAFEPSNGGLTGSPLRSGAGFPLVYAQAPDGHGGLLNIGTPAVNYAGIAFNSDAEVLDYIARTAPHDAQAAQQWGEAFARMGHS